MANNQLITPTGPARPSTTFPHEIVLQIFSDPVIDRKTLKAIVRTNYPALSRPATQLYWQIETPSNRLLARLCKMARHDQQAFAYLMHKITVQFASRGQQPDARHLNFPSVKELRVVLKRVPESQMNTGITDAELNHFVGPLLRVLSIAGGSGRPITSHFLSCLALCSDLTESDINAEVLCSLPHSLAEVLHGCRKLEALKLGRHAAVLVNPCAIQAIADHPHLRAFEMRTRLTLNMIPVAAEDVSLFPNITSIKLHLDSDVVGKLLPLMAKLVEIDLIVHGDTSVFKQLSKVASLRSMRLSLEGRTMTNDDLAHLTALVQLKHLALKTDLRANFLLDPPPHISSDVLGSVLSALSKLESLEYDLSAGLTCLPHEFYDPLLATVGYTCPGLKSFRTISTCDLSELENNDQILFPSRATRDGLRLHNQWHRVDPSFSSMTFLR